MLNLFGVNCKYSVCVVFFVTLLSVFCEVSVYMNFCKFSQISSQIILFTYNRNNIIPTMNTYKLCLSVTSINYLQQNDTIATMDIFPDAYFSADTDCTQWLMIIVIVSKSAYPSFSRHVTIVTLRKNWILVLHKNPFSCRVY